MQKVLKNERRRISRNASLHWVRYSATVGVLLCGDYAAALKKSKQTRFWQLPA